MFTASSLSCSRVQHSACDAHSACIAASVPDLDSCLIPALLLYQCRGTCPALRGWCTATSWDGIKQGQDSAKFQSHNSPCPVECDHLHSLAFPCSEGWRFSKNRTKHKAQPHVKAESTINTASPSVCHPKQQPACYTWRCCCSSAPSSKEALSCVTVWSWMNISAPPNS